MTTRKKNKIHTLQYASSERPSTQTPLRWRLNAPFHAIWMRHDAKTTNAAVYQWHNLGTRVKRCFVPVIRKVLNALSKHLFKICCHGFACRLLLCSIVMSQWLPLVINIQCSVWSLCSSFSFLFFSPMSTMSISLFRFSSIPGKPGWRTSKKKQKGDGHRFTSSELLNKLWREASCQSWTHNTRFQFPVLA